MNKRPKNIELSSQLLTGVGASSWFYISKEKANYRIKRYSEKGKLECSRIFFIDDTSFDINKDFAFTYVSHCKECTIIQNEKRYVFKTEEYGY